MVLHRWILVVSMLWLQESCRATTLPPRLPVHVNIQTSKAQRIQAGSSVHTKPFPPRRSTCTTCHFWHLLDPPLLAEASTVAVRVTSIFASATEDFLALGALSADFLGGTISSAIATFDVEFLASLPPAPAFLLADPGGVVSSFPLLLLPLGTRHNPSCPNSPNRIMDGLWLIFWVFTGLVPFSNLLRCRGSHASYSYPPTVVCSAVDQERYRSVTRSYYRGVRDFEWTVFWFNSEAVTIVIWIYLTMW